MKKWLMLILALLLISVSAYSSSIVLTSVEKPLFCADCHPNEYADYIFPIYNSNMPSHKENKITCIDCHSSPGIESTFTDRKILLKAKIINSSLPAINSLFRANFTFNNSFNVSDFSILKANCTKCHDIKKIKTRMFNHSNASNCKNCHLVHKDNKSQKPEVSFWKRMGEGGHKNLTCGDCHGTEAAQLSELPQCTECHSPHLKGAQADRSTCLGCHNDPHLPVKNAVFKGTVTKEMCAACHNSTYQTLAVYDSKHNKNVPACINCHLKHMEAKSCMNCHTPHGQYHLESKCYSCHAYVNKCTDCHTNPHAPLSGLPAISKEQWTEYAKQAGKK